MPNANLTAIAVVLDRSGSMSNVREATVGGLNTFFRTQRETVGDVRLTLVQFDDLYEVKADFVDLKTFPDLTQEDFVPRGWTALLDGIGKTVHDLGVRFAGMTEEERPGKVIVVVQTDGGENASREFNIKQIQDLIKEQTTKYAWEFVFLGANQDAIATGTGMGFAAASSMSYNSNPLSTGKTFQVVGSVVSNTRSLRSKGISGQSVFSDASRAYAGDDNLEASANYVQDPNAQVLTDPNTPVKIDPSILATPVIPSKP